MKKYIIYTIILALGLGLGWILFGQKTHKEINKNKDLHEHKKESQKQTWTCSMHPQIKLHNPGSCPICGMDLIPIKENLSREKLSKNQFKMTKNALTLANVESFEIGTKNMSEQQQNSKTFLSGTIRENDENNWIQTSHFNGRIEKLYVNSIGKKVKKGQLLALVYSPEIVIAQKELLIAMEIKSSQMDLYNAVRGKLKLWKLSNNQINKIENTRKIITNFPVYSDNSGVVKIKKIKKGSHLKEGDVMFEMSDYNTLWAEFDLPESQSSLVKEGDKIDINVNNSKDTIHSKIEFVNPILGESSRNIIVRSTIKNRKNKLKPGMFITALVKSKNKTQITKNNITIPSSAVLWTGQKSMVYMMNEDNSSGIFESREVILGDKIGSHYKVLKGLKKGDKIVSNGVFVVDASAQLQGKKSMMNENNSTKFDEIDNENKIDKTNIHNH